MTEARASGADDSRRRTGRLLGGAVALVAVATCAALGWATGEPAIGWLFLLLALAVTLAVGALRARELAQRRRRFEAELGGSLDSARAQLEVESLRALRAARGDAVTARAIQKQLPQLTLAQVAELLHSL